MYHYYLTPNTQDTDTIYIINTISQTAAEDAAYLVDRIGCERITRRVALGMNAYSVHAGRHSLWARPTNRPTDPTLAEALLDAVDATREMIEKFRYLDKAQARS